MLILTQLMMSWSDNKNDQERVAIKKQILKILEKMPIIEKACHKVGISRMTLSRWRKKDIEFNKKMEEVLSVSRQSINDLAESKMIQKIQEGTPSMIALWLRNNCKRYQKNSNTNNRINDFSMDKDYLNALYDAVPLCLSQSIDAMSSKDIYKKENNV